MPVHLLFAKFGEVRSPRSIFVDSRSALIAATSVFVVFRLLCTAANSTLITANSALIAAISAQISIAPLYYYVMHLWLFAHLISSYLILWMIWAFDALDWIVHSNIHLNWYCFSFLRWFSKSLFKYEKANEITKQNENREKKKWTWSDKCNPLQCLTWVNLMCK